MKKLLPFIIAFYLFTSYSFSIENPRFENLTSKNGLSQNTIRCMMQDSQGFMWIGTMNGLNRYDGRAFTIMQPKFGEAISLPDNRIKNIIEDKNGFIWIHTISDIISCYDPRLENFISYNLGKDDQTYKSIFISSTDDVWLLGIQKGCLRIQHNKDKLYSTTFDIEQNIVEFIFESSDKTIWIGTNEDLYYVSGNKAIKCNTGKSKLHFQSAEEIGKHIYFFTNNNLILVFDREKKSFGYDIKLNAEGYALKINNTGVLNNQDILITTQKYIYLLDTNQSMVLPAENLFDKTNLPDAFIHFDNKKNPWIYNKTGALWKYDKNNNKFAKIELIPPSVVSLIDLERFTIYEDSRNIIWITTYGNGLFALDQHTRKISHFKADKNQANNLQTNYLLSLTEDKSGEIWVGSEYAGIFKLSMTNYNNKAFFPEENNSSNTSKTIRLIYEDVDENIWIGTKNGHIYLFDKTLHKKLKTYNTHEGMPYTLAKDSAGNKWVGTKGGGLIIISPDGSEEYQVNNKYKEIKDAPNNIYAILRDSKNRMWLGSFGQGLLITDKKEGKISFHNFSAISNIQKRIRTIKQDKEGLIWVGGNNGLTIFNPEELLSDPNKFTSFHFNYRDIKSINNDEIKIIFEDSKGRIWLGTSGGGINLAIKEKTLKKTWFKHYTTENGLINNVVQAILEDSNGYLWISTESGISKFNPEKETFENYNFSDTTEGDLFCESSCFKRKNGDLIFGSYNGMYIFDPSKFGNNTYAPPVMITGLKINGNTVIPNGKDSPLSLSISLTDNITLKNDQNSFNIEFATLNFSNSSANRYTYILEGYEKQWNPITQFNVATYRNIPPGKYKFKVKGCNSFGVWNENETILEIVVVPPIWKSPQAVVFYIISLLILTFIAIRIALKMNKLNNAVEVEKQLTDYKLRFFTNISHEFRTPLTIIQGTIENLNSEKNVSPSVNNHIKILEKSSVRLLRLIDQLLEFRRLQNNKMELNLELTEVISFFHDIYTMFSESAKKKRIQLEFHTNEPEWKMLIDKGKMDKIVYNLLSNAFKYTSQEGIIKMNIHIDQPNDIFTLSISDNGIGVPREKQALLFVRFKQINYSSSGTGIGLHLTSELANVHKGEVQYSDSDSGGACFTVSIPLSEKNYENNNIISTSQPLAIHSEPTKIAIDELSKDNFDTKEKSLKNYKILVIEDDEEVREFLKNQLSEYFDVIDAENGLTGLEKASVEQPNLIICDVMMPEMDGFQVTKKLKAEFQTSHIPVIILTAHASAVHQLEGIESGADAYITKPFSIKYLMARIAKLIEQREMLQQKFAKEPGLLKTSIYATERDKEFIEQIHQIIERNLDNPDFSVIDFAQAVNMGKTVFYKKVKGVTGYSPNEYLKVMRMKKAAELLTTTDLNVSEVSYKVGINDPFYFSRCFKSQFGISPSQYTNK